MQAQGPAVLETTKQGPETRDSKWAWVKASIWTDRMLAALGNGVKGDKWFSLVDKVYRSATLHAAWLRVKANQGAAGVDGGVSLTKVIEDLTPTLRGWFNYFKH